MSGIHLPNISPENRALSTLAAWRKFVATPHTIKPTLMPLEEYKKLESHQRNEYNLQRRRYLANFRVETSDMRRVWKILQIHMAINLQTDHGLLTGMVVDGVGTVGKSVLVTQFARRFEREMRQNARFDEHSDEHLFCPVVYVELTSDVTPKGLSRSILSFFGDAFPRSRLQTTTDLTESIQKAFELRRVLLLIIDDIHFIRHNNTAAAKLSDHLKTLMNRTRTTLLCAGIGCDVCGFLKEGSFSNPALSQTGGRLLHCPVTPYTKNSESWLELTELLDKSLCLLDHSPDQLKKLSSYLYNRTQGRLGSLVRLIAAGAGLAIAEGQERLTKNLLDKIDLDYNATTFGSKEL